MLNHDKLDVGEKAGSSNVTSITQLVKAELDIIIKVTARIWRSDSKQQKGQGGVRGRIRRNFYIIAV